MEQQRVRDLKAQALDKARLQDTGIQMDVSPTRCPFCHDAIGLEGDDWVACGSCLARHHDPCWLESGACAACGAVKRLISEGVLERSEEELRDWLYEGEVEKVTGYFQRRGASAEEAFREAAELAFKTLEGAPRLTRIRDRGGLWSGGLMGLQALGLLICSLVALEAAGAALATTLIIMVLTSMLLMPFVFLGKVAQLRLGQLGFALANGLYAFGGIVLAELLNIRSSTDSIPMFLFLAFIAVLSGSQAFWLARFRAQAAKKS